jgi:hypothetical protein
MLKTRMKEIGPEATPPVPDQAPGNGRLPEAPRVVAKRSTLSRLVALARLKPLLG